MSIYTDCISTPLTDAPINDTYLSITSRTGCMSLTAGILSIYAKELSLQSNTYDYESGKYNPLELSFWSNLTDRNGTVLIRDGVWVGRTLEDACSSSPCGSSSDLVRLDANGGLAVGNTQGSIYRDSIVISGSAGFSGSCHSVVIGNRAGAQSKESVVIGTCASSEDPFSVVIGGGASSACQTGRAAAIGWRSFSGDEAVAIGACSMAPANGTAIGYQTYANYNSIAIGHQARTEYNCGSIAIRVGGQQVEFSLFDLVKLKDYCDAQRSMP